MKCAIYKRFGVADYGVQPLEHLRVGPINLKLMVIIFSQWLATTAKSIALYGGTRPNISHRKFEISLYNAHNGMMEAVKVAITVELYKEVRRMHLDGVSQRQLATRLGISRNTVKKYLDGNVVPWERKTYARPATALRPEVLAFIENCLETHRREGTKNQHHTAKRIYDCLV